MRNYFNITKTAIIIPKTFWLIMNFNEDFDDNHNINDGSVTLAVMSDD
jgi:hypothetical protein